MTLAYIGGHINNRRIIELSNYPVVKEDDEDRGGPL